MNYWLTDEQRTRLTASIYTGPNAIFAAPGLAGNHDTMVELRIQQDWSPRFTQVVQSNMGWDSDTPVGTGSWYGVYTIGIFHLTDKLDINGRAEWFDDVKGTRTGHQHQLCRGHRRPELPSRCGGSSSARRSAATSPARRPSGGTVPIIIATC